MCLFRPMNGRRVVTLDLCHVNHMQQRLLLPHVTGVYVYKLVKFCLRLTVKSVCCHYVGLINYP